MQFSQAPREIDADGQEHAEDETKSSVPHRQALPLGLSSGG